MIVNIISLLVLALLAALFAWLATRAWRARRAFVKWPAVILAGLEPFAGFMHVDRPGRPSLVLDLIEEFRQPVVDRVIIAMFSKGREVMLEEGKLPADIRKELAAKILERLDATENYNGKKHKLQNIIQSQARSLASFVRGDGKYRAFVGGW